MSDIVILLAVPWQPDGGPADEIVTIALRRCALESVR